MDLLRSLPIGLYLEKPVTWLHHLDPRVKLAWLMSFLVAPLLANPLWRIGLSLVLVLITLGAGIPFRAFKQQVGWLIFLCGLVLILTAFSPDGFGVINQPRLPPREPLPPASDYQYVLWQQGNFQVTRRSLELGIRISTLVFTLIYSTTLFLLTTAPEEITCAIEELMEPLRRFNLPVTEISLILTLSLRFIPLVLEEIQNLFRSIRTRAINWKQLGLKRSFRIWILVIERLLENLLLRAEQIAIAMEVRGFTTPDQHRIQWHQLRMIRWDWLALFALIPFWWARLLIGGMSR
jgi:energy-coupling factor transport system permease protein